MPDVLQLDFFPSLDFPGRTTVLVREIAARLGVSEKHLFREIDSGALVVLDLKAAGSSRRCARVPVESYRAYIEKHLTAPVTQRSEFIRHLPVAVRRSLLREIEESLKHSA
jgi:hypothetical protein